MQCDGIVFTFSNHAEKWWFFLNFGAMLKVPFAVLSMPSLDTARRYNYDTHGGYDVR